MLAKAGERHRLARRGCARKTGPDSRARAVFAFGLDIDLPLPAEPVEVVDKVAAHEGLQRLVNLADVHSLLQRLVAVHVHVELRARPAGRWCSELAISGRLRAASMNLVTFAARNGMSLPARSSRTKVNPPAVPTPGMAGGGKAKAMAPGSLDSSLVQVRLDGVVLFLRLVALAPVLQAHPKKAL